MPDHHLNALRHVAELLELLLGEGRVLLISRDEDGLYTASASGRASQPARHSAAFDLEGCIEELTGNMRMKICLRPGCVSEGKPRPLWSFGPDKDSADGHSGECRSCAAKRIGAIGKRKKGETPSES